MHKIDFANFENFDFKVAAKVGKMHCIFFHISLFSTGTLLSAGVMGQTV